MKKGTKIKIYSTDQKDFLGIGEYIGSERVDFRFMGFGFIWTPIFKLGRKKIKGSECWWIKLSEAKKIEKELLTK
ncbi:MAG: hypothetical protein WC026_13285 [Hyphomicrobium sp.]|uniref:hypothetical protein n=1 Tax=Hyphomicrobium sp. TaxID=82 RepID=UPI0035688508